MTDKDFKKLADTESNMFELCYKYYVAEAKEKGYIVYSQHDFDQSFQMFLMMMGFGDISGVLNEGVNNLKKQHNYK
jgi:hypothetical protein